MTRCLAAGLIAAGLLLFPGCGSSTTGEPAPPQSTAASEDAPARADEATPPQQASTPDIAAAEDTPAAGLHRFTMARIDGADQPLAAYRGKVVLLVNTASKCGNTPQYAGLQKLYETYQDRGLVVLGFPANNFGKQEPGTNDEIAEFCTLKYRVTFPMFAKISVKGDDQDPLYAWLTSETGGEDVRWNFEKFLVGADGQIIGRFSPRTQPDDAALLEAITTHLPEAGQAM